MTETVSCCCTVSTNFNEIIIYGVFLFIIAVELVNLFKYLVIKLKTFVSMLSYCYYHDSLGQTIELATVV